MKGIRDATGLHEVIALLQAGGGRVPHLLGCACPEYSSHHIELLGDRQ